jgi:hypothetical protein
MPLIDRKASQSLVDLDERDGGLFSGHVAAGFDRHTQRLSQAYFRVRRLAEIRYGGRTLEVSELLVRARQQQTRIVPSRTTLPTAPWCAHSLITPTAFAYYLVVRPEATALAKIVRFRDWLKLEATQTAAIATHQGSTSTPGRLHQLRW